MSTKKSATQSTQLWLLKHVCPYWCERIVDPQGGFYESLNAQGQASQSPLKTVLNQARLTYVFSHASVLGGDASLRRAANHGFDFLRRASVASGSAAGWPRGLNAQAEVLDPTRDTYDQAFVIFAMAWYYRVSASEEALQLAEQAFGFLETRLADAAHGGFFEEYPATDKLPRRQNPHMHLLEAVLAMHAATGQQIWLDRATRLIALFNGVFFDEKTGSLAEFFDAAWTLADGAPGLLREPGHQFEWVWLLQQYLQQATDLTPDIRDNLQGHAHRLFDFGSQHGIDTTGPLQGLVFDAVTANGQAVAPSKLLWTQTEYIKACIARFEVTQDAGYRQQAFAHADLMRAHFFRSDAANWVNHIARDGTPLVSDTPSRVLYHLFLAMAELIRIEAS